MNKMQYVALDVLVGLEDRLSEIVCRPPGTEAEKVAYYKALRDVYREARKPVGLPLVVSLAIDAAIRDAMTNLRVVERRAAESTSDGA